MNVTCPACLNTDCMFEPHLINLAKAKKTFRLISAHEAVFRVVKPVATCG